MNILKKLLVATALTTIVFLVQGIVSMPSAHAELYKLNFTSEEANGYLVFDDSVQGTPHPVHPQIPITTYLNSIVDYDVNFKGEIVEHNSETPETNLKDNSKTVVYLMNREIFELANTDPLFPHAEAQKFLPLNSSNWNEFTFFILPPVRHSPFALVVRFKYPEGTFSHSTAQPTQLSHQASVLVFPQYNFPKTMGYLGFQGEVQTTIEKLS